MLRIMNDLKKHCLNLSLILFGLIVVSNLIWIVNSFINIQLADSAIDKSLSGFLLNIGMIVILMMVNTVLRYFIQLIQARIKRRQTLRYKSDLSYSILADDRSNLTNTESGKYVSRYVTDINVIMTNGYDQFFLILDAIISILISLAGSMLIHWSFGFIFPISFFLTTIISRKISPKIQHESIELSGKREVYIAQLNDLLGGIMILLRNSNAQYFYNTNRSYSEEYEDHNYRYQISIAKYMNIIILGSIASQMIYVIATCFLILKSYIPLSAIVGLFSISNQLFSSGQRLFNSISILQSAIPLTDKISSQSSQNELSFKESDVAEVSEITLENVTIGYANKPLLNTLNLKVKKGRKYALVGDSGVGKSTLVKTIMGEVPVLSGRIRINGKEIRELHQNSIYGNIGYISQPSYVFNKTVRENISLNEPFPGSKFSSIVDKVGLTHQLSLDQVIQDNGKNISGGQKQRLVLARELIRDKKVIIMDEGINALDSSSRKAIEGLLFEDPDLTLIYILHPNSESDLNRFDEVINLNEYALA